MLWHESGATATVNAACSSTASFSTAPAGGADGRLRQLEFKQQGYLTAVAGANHALLQPAAEAGYLGALLHLSLHSQVLLTYC